MNLSELIPLIKPNGKDENGKYNKKLYNLLKKLSASEYYNRQLKVYFCLSDRITGDILTFHKDIHKEKTITRQILFSPYGNSASGHFLSEAIKKNNPEHWSLCMYHEDLFIEVTDWFFKNYIELGRCFFDKYHYDFDNEYNERYYIINKNNRKCKWCGEHFHMEHYKKVEIKRYKTWGNSKVLISK